MHSLRLLLVLSAVFVSPLVAQQQQGSPFVTPLCYPDHKGHVILQGSGGTTGSTVTIKYTFEGFYVQPVYALSNLPKDYPIPPEMTPMDTYEVYPISTTLMIKGEMEGVLASTVNDGEDTFTHAKTKPFFYQDTFNLPAIEPDELANARLYKLKGKVPSITVMDQRPIGKDAVFVFNGGDISWQLGLKTLADVILLEGADPETVEIETGKGRNDAAEVFRELIDVQVDHYRDGSLNNQRTDQVNFRWSATIGRPPYLTGAPGTSRIGIQHGRPGIFWQHDSPVALAPDSSPIDLTIRGHVGGKVDTNNSTNATMPADKTYLMRCEWDIRLDEDPKATMEVVAQDDGTLMLNDFKSPEHTYRVTLEKPGHNEIEELRVILDDVTQYPGICTNAGNHKRFVGRNCTDCTTGVERHYDLFRTTFNNDPSRQIKRRYQTYGGCPIDEAPDIHFRDDKNLDFELKEGKKFSSLRYEIDTEMTLINPESDEVDVVVSIKDGAAWGKMRAEIKVAGKWYDVGTKGASASPDNKHFQIPIDKNGDKMADSWEADGFPKKEDDDQKPKSVKTGDGLTVFEEYRGVFSQGAYKRPDPFKKTVFVHDYNRCFRNDLGMVELRYGLQDIEVIQLSANEMREDVVNWNETGYEITRQYVIVVVDDASEKLIAKWGAEATFGHAAGATGLGPPTSKNNTVLIVLNSGLRTGGTVGHEIGHLMGVRHHGALDFRTEDGHAVSIAQRGGQHSGQEDCFMRYSSARYYLDSTKIYDDYSAMVSDLPDWKVHLKRFPPSSDRTSFCLDGKGTGINADGACCGDATGGYCITQINLRSR